MTVYVIAGFLAGFIASCIFMAFGMNCKDARRDAYRRGVLETRLKYGVTETEVVFPDDLNGEPKEE